MLMNVTLIPFLLGIFVNISQFSDFDPEYVYILNQTKTEYGEFIDFTELTSTIICQPLKDELHCYLNDIMSITSKYTNFNDRITTSNLIEVGHWFHMKFMDRGLTSMNMERGAGVTNNYLIIDVVSQFNMGIDAIVQSLHSNSTVTETTPIGFCTTTYNMNMRFWKEDEKQETGNFKIKLFKNFSNQENIKSIHIVKNRKNCNHSITFNDSFLRGGKVTKYVHTIEVIDNKLRMFTILDGQRPHNLRNSSETSTFTHITQLNLINVRSKKTILFIDASEEIEN